MTRKKTYYACPWACGRKVKATTAGANGRKLCWECRAFLKTYREARVFHGGDRGNQCERYASVKAGRVELYRALASAKLPLFAGAATGTGTAAGGRAT